MKNFIACCLCFALIGAAAAASVSGRVVDPQGNPVPGLQLRLFKEDRLVAVTNTGADGEYSTRDLSPGRYVLLIHKLGFQQERIEIAVESEDTLRHDIRLLLARLEESVVVTATRTETPTSYLGNTVTVIRRDEIEASRALSVADVLRQVAGVHLRTTGGRGSLTTLFVRGGESNYTTVLIDGIPLNQPGGDVDLSNLSTANIERIEIVRGPQSALYGSGAVSSVVQIFTRRGSPEGRLSDFELAAEGGTYGTFSGEGAIRGALERFDYSLNFRHLSTDNRVPNDFFHSNSFSAGFGLRVSENSDLRLISRMERSKTGVPGPTAFGRPDLEEFYRKRDFLVGISWNQQLNPNWSHRVSYSQTYVNQLSEDPVDSGPYFPEFNGIRSPFQVFDFPFSFLAATRRHTLNYQNDFLLSGHLMSVGMDYEEQRGTVGETQAERTNLGYYLQDQFLWRGRLAVTAGLRFEDNGSFGFFASPRVSTAYLLRAGSGGTWGMTRPKFSFGLGIKEPTFIESYSPNFFFIGNPDLKPERTRSFEAGLEQLLANDRIRIETNLFRSDFHDLIAFRTVDPETFAGSFFNIGESRAWGVEEIAEVRLAERLKVRSGYTYLNTEVIRSRSPFSPVLQEGAPLLLRPRHSGFIVISWIERRWSLSSALLLVGSRSDSDFGLGLGLTEVGGFQRWDLAGGYRLTPEVELYAAFNNLLNQDYFESLGFPALRFNFRSGLRFRF